MTTTRGAGPDGKPYPQNRRHKPRTLGGIPDDLWEAAKQRAGERGETVTDVVLRALARYVR